ncbi:hypothetical protein K490DRAFT_64893 [Saccharata proteae CBS 121410]|uniref:Uncharacterized protein n=1 Tax=Saccharata proteae CBS 121410 TaxID=1314787 RepID=A0A9P4LZK9_9PEZI|nr:hypothetical protein K490DRAFT_64893 [Saccharata proteae CBS 121410]
MEYPPQQRPRSKSGFSFRSDKSDKSHGSHPRESLHESVAEKRKTHLSSTSKANPNAAMEEAQPVAQALQASTLGSLREYQHKDASGNPIDEPDISNPTRPRWERPLDTIRSFEAAVDGRYKRKTSMQRTESTPEMGNGYASRRSSYYGGGHDGQNHRGSQVGGGYYGRNRDSYQDGYGGPVPKGPTRDRYGQRMQSDNQVPRYPNSGPGVYPSHSYQHSRDTVNTGNSSSQSDPYGNSTDPSSENSSIERATPGPKAEANEHNNYSGFGQDPIMEEYDSTRPQPVGGYPQGKFGPPPVPKHGGTGAVAAPARSVIKLGDGPPTPLNNASGNSAAPPRRPPMESHNSEKRKSWFKRRFSKD